MIAAPDTALVLAAGLGTRMRPLTNDKPKPLIEVGGRALVDHMLDRMGAAGVQRAVVNVHYCADQMETHLARRASPAITISDERDQLLETGGALAKVRPILGEAPIFIANTDSIWSEDGVPAFDALRRNFDPTRMDFLLLLARLDQLLGFGPKGDFALLPDRRIAWPKDAPDAAHYAYTGVQLIRPQVADGAPVEPFSLRRFWDAALEQGRMYGIVLDGFWMHVGDPQARDEADAKLAALRAQSAVPVSS
ncbi:MAG: nucleotidyltransferase family protein [Caulobacterales bacterium]